jgi:hypothetical protein
MDRIFLGTLKKSSRGRRVSAMRLTLLVLDSLDVFVRREDADASSRRSEAMIRSSPSLCGSRSGS